MTVQNSDHFHGSDLEKIEEIYGIPKEAITSFSANINPLGISPLLRQALAEKIDAITAYPDREYTSLRKAIARYAGTEPGNVIVGNGSTELISLFIQIAHPRKALIIGPTYSEYEREISLGGGACLYYPLKEQLGFLLDTEDFLCQLNERIDLLVICNPNNPTSTAISRPEMRRILDVCKQNDIFVMIDETYVEFVQDIDSITAVPLTHYYNNLIILRGVSKFFAAPGLRLGYALTGNQDLAKSIHTRQNPWTINSLAEVAGEIMFSDDSYIQQTRELIARERERVYSAAAGIGWLKPYAPVANFILVQILDEALTSRDVFKAAIRQGMMIRDCSTFPFLDHKYFRFCFMDRELDDRLLGCIRELRRE